MAKSTASLKLCRSIIGSRSQLCHALVTSPNSCYVVLDLSGAPATRVDLGASEEEMVDGDSDDDTTLLARALDAFAALRHPLTSLVVLHLSGAVPLPTASTLSYLATCGLTELELKDASIERAATDGASNLLRPMPSRMAGDVSGGVYTVCLADSIRARGAAMLRLARALPALRRLSLCNAAFPASDVAALDVLVQLEELSLFGAMECGGGPAGQSGAAEQHQRQMASAAAAAAAVHQRLLAALPRLREVRLPMAVAAPPPHAGEWAGHLYDSSDENDADADADIDEWDAFRPGCGGIAIRDNSIGGSSIGGGAFSSFTSAPFSSGMRVAAAASSGASAFLAEALSYLSYGSSDVMSCEPADGALGAPAGSAPSGWSFPPTLTDLTIPLCSLNGPVFRAACEAYGRDCSSDLGRDKAGSSGRGISSLFPLSSAHDCHGNVDGGRSSDSTARGLRALHIPCAPGYTMWEGSFLTADRDFEALSRLASLETLHLSLELGSSGRDALRRDGLRACFQHLKALHCLKDLRICSAQQPVCFSARKRTCGQVDNLLSYVLGTDGQAAAPQISIRLPILPPLGGRNVRPRPTVSWQPAASPFHGWPPAEPPRPSAPALTGLLVHWPQLQTLVVAEQSAFRTSRGGKDCLVAPASLEELVALREAHVAS